MTADSSTASSDNRREDDGSRVRWLSPASLRLHATLTLGVAACYVGARIEWPRALSGHHPVAWAYSFEWPLFAMMGVWVWWKLLHADLSKPPPRTTPPTSSGRLRRHRQIPTSDADPGLVAWQAYLERLNAADPPGGPPGESARG